MRGASRAPKPSEPLPLPHSHTAQILPPLNRHLAFDSHNPPFVPPGHYYHFAGDASSNAIDKPDTIVVKPLLSSAVISLSISALFLILLLVDF